MKLWKLYILIILLSLFPLVDMFRTPDLPHTSDGAMHLARFAVYYKELMAGQFPVRFASQINYGYGSMMFNFYYPLPYMIGVPLIALGLSLVAVLKVSFSITYILAGVFMLLFCLSFFKDKKTALFVTIMYQYAPFRLVDMLVRGSLGSLYSYMVLPLLFYALIKFIDKNTYPRFILIVLSTALLTTSHNVIGFAFLGISMFYILFATKNIKGIITMYLAMAVGLGLAGSYLIPAILEHKYTNGYLFTKDLFYQHFPPFYTLVIPNITNMPSLRTAEVSVQIGIFHVLAFFVAIYLLIKNKLQGKWKTLAVYILLVSLLTILFMQPITKPIWENVPLIRQFQFPWRFLAIICFTSALVSSFAISHIAFLQKKLVYGGLIFIVIISTIYYWTPYQGYQKVSQEYYWNYYKMASYFGEFNTIWMAHEPMEYPKKRIEVIAGSAEILSIKLSSTKHVFLVDSENKSTIVDRTYFYPGWKVSVDNNLVPIEFQDQNYRGLITFVVPEGNHKIIVKYQENKLQRFGDIVSIFAVAVLIAGVFIFRRKNSK